MRLIRAHGLRMVLAVLLVVLALGAGVVIHLLYGLLSLRIAAAPGVQGAQIASAIVQVFAADHPTLRFRVKPEPTLPAAAGALGRDRADLAIVRSDAAGEDGQTLAILRRDAVVFVAGRDASIDGIGALRGRSVGLLGDEVFNGRVLDRVLAHYGVPAEHVHRTAVTLDTLPAALRARRIDAVFVLAPVDAPIWRAMFAAVRKGAHGTPKIVEVDEAAAIAKENPGLETVDISKGALQGSLPAPDDDITTLSVSYRLVARAAMPDWLAGEITREVLTRKLRLAAIEPDLSGIEAPDTDDKSAALPIHAGAAAYLSGDLPSLSDQLQNALYWLGLVASAVVSMGAAGITVVRRIRPRRPPTRVMRLLDIWLGLPTAAQSEVAGLEAELDRLVHATIHADAHGRADEQETRLIGLLAEQIRPAIQRRILDLRLSA